MTKEGSGKRVYTPKPLTMDSICAKSTEEGNCLLWNGGTTQKGFPYAYVGGVKTNLRPYVYGTILGKPLRAGFLMSVRCGNRACLSEYCLVARSVSQVRKDAHARMRSDPLKFDRTRNGIRAAGLTKLDMGKAMDIRRSPSTARELASLYGVTERTIQEIRAGSTYVNPGPVCSIFALAASIGASQ